MGEGGEVEQINDSVEADVWEAGEGKETQLAARERQDRKPHPPDKLRRQATEVGV